MSGWQGLANCLRKWRDELDPAQAPAWLEVSKAVYSKTNGRGWGAASVVKGHFGCYSSSPRTTNFSCRKPSHCKSSS